LEQKINDIEIQQSSTTVPIVTEKPTITIEPTPVDVIKPKPASPKLEAPEQVPATPPENNNNNLDNSIDKIAKCAAQKELLITNSKSTIEKYFRDNYLKILEMIDSSDNCADGILPETISICHNSHTSLAESEARKATDEYETFVNATIQEFYIKCLNK